MLEPVSLVLIGAGNRGRGIFGQYALDMPHRANFVAVVEPDPAKRREFADAHGISPDRCFENCSELFSLERFADAVVVATPDNARTEPILGALDRGYHILTEKPIANTLADTASIVNAAAGFDGIFMVCHQMRYVPPFYAIKSLIDSGEYGNILCIQHSENLAFSHMAHSFVRGWVNSSAVSPMILQKSCHDMDILSWWTGKRPRRVASFGSLTHFTPENAPAGAPHRCLDGCPAEAECPYSVLKLYFNDDTDPAFLRQMGVFDTKQELMELLKTNRFGRCVYHCDNDVVDHQVVIVEFEDDITVNFTMCGQNAIERRKTQISLDNGEIELDFSEANIRAHTFSPRNDIIIQPQGVRGTHGGGDRLIMDSLVDAIQTGDRNRVLTSVQMSFDSHLLAFAAEESRLTGNVIDMNEFEAKARAAIKSPGTAG